MSGLTSFVAATSALHLHDEPAWSEVAISDQSSVNQNQPDPALEPPAESPDDASTSSQPRSARASLASNHAPPQSTSHNTVKNSAVGPVAIGVHFRHSDASPSRQLLSSLKETGIQFLLVDGIIPRSDLIQILDFNFELWVRSDAKFLRRHDITANHEELSQQITDPVYYYRNASVPVQKYLIASYPRNSATVLEFLYEQQRIIHQLTPIPSTILSTPGSMPALQHANLDVIPAIDELHELNDFLSNRTVYVLPPTFDNSPCHSLREAMEIAHSNGIQLIFPGDYLLSLWESNPCIPSVILEYSTASQPVIALAPESAQVYTINATTIMMLVAWALFFLLFYSSGAYHRSVIRYIFTHNFFINDVMMRRIKPRNELLIGMLMLLLFGGLLATVIFRSFTSSLTSEMLQSYGGIWAALDTGDPVLLFLTGGGLTLSMLIVGLLWLSVASLGSHSIGQLMQLLIVPLQIVVPVASVLAILLLNGVYGAVYLYTGLAVLGFLLFVPLIASIDMIPFMNLTKRRFIIAGPIGYSIAVICGVGSLFYYTPFADSIRLLIQLLH